MTKRQRGSTPVPPDEVGVEPGIEPGRGQQGTGVLGPVQATGDRGARVCAADYGLPMAGAVKSGLGKRIGIVTDSDSCPTLCCLVLTGEHQDRRKWLWTLWPANSNSAGLHFLSSNTCYPPPPPPFRFSVLGGGGA